MKILLQQKSGLGNQLFQYAAGLYFAGDTQRHWRSSANRRSALCRSGIPGPFCYRSSVSPHPCGNVADGTVCSAPQPLTNASPQSPPDLSRELIFTSPTFAPTGFFVPELPVASAKKIYIDGYFQAHQYAQSNESRLRSELTLRDAPAGKNLETSKQIRACQSSVSLHVRRGDYTKIYGGRDALPITYYQNAIDTMREHASDPTFFVFSDDIAFCRENLPAGPRYIFVDHNSQTEAHEDLRLMSSCQHHIMANSSFSWWERGSTPILTRLSSSLTAGSIPMFHTRIFCLRRGKEFLQPFHPLPLRSLQPLTTA